MGLQTSVKINAVGMFKNLGKCATKRATEASFVMASQMKYTLEYKQRLAIGLGHYPVWDGSGGKPSKDSASKWTINQKGTMFYLTNSGVATDGYPYPTVLSYGMPKEKAKRNPFWKHYPSKNLVVGPKDRVYSRQMPKGIQPWIDKQKIVLEKRIEKAIVGCRK